MANVETEPTGGGPSSFCIPRAALNALIDAQATAYDICAYLILACFTDGSGQFSTASLHAIGTYTEARKNKGGPLERAVARLKKIRAKRRERVPNGRTGKAHQMIDQLVDLGPILFDREAWQAEKQLPLPDGPTERSKILHVLPDFGELLDERVWFGSNLVKGVAGFDRPMKALKNAGDVAARLLLLMHAISDMETWGGVRPVIDSDDGGPWQRYEPVDEDVHLRGAVRLLRAKRSSVVGPGGLFKRAWPGPSHGDWSKLHSDAGQPVFTALDALLASGFMYEVVMVLNRDAVKKKFSSGEEYSAIPPGEVEPLYELDTRSLHGYKPKGEEGIGGLVASTAGDLGHPVTTSGGVFDGTYVAFVLQGHGAMIAGIYRPRFRVANRNNAGVSNAWARIYQNKRDALELLQRVRMNNSLSPLALASENEGKKQAYEKGKQPAEIAG